MKKILLPAFCVLLLIVSCNRQKENPDTPVIHSNTKNKAVFSDLFEDIIVVPLETHASGLLGLTALRIEVFQNKIFILNRLSSRSNILCFDSSGQFLFTIDKFGNGPEEYTHLGDFFIDRKNECLVLISEKGNFYRFDFSGQFMDKKHTEDVYYSRHASYLNDSTVLIFNDQNVLPQGIDLLSVDLNTFNIGTLSASKSVLSGIIPPRLPVSIHREQALLYDATDTIFDISDISNRIAKYAIDFGSSHRSNLKILIQSVKNLTDNEISEKIFEYFADKQLFTLPALFENNDFLVVGYAENSKPAKKIDMKYSFLLHDKKNQLTYNSCNIAFDVLNLPDMGNFNILGKYNDAFYALYTFDWTSENREKILQSKNLSEELKRYIIDGNEERNSILLCFW